MRQQTSAPLIILSSVFALYIGLIQTCCPHNTGAVAERFDELVDMFANDSASYALHALIFKTMAEQHPEVE